MEFLAGMGAGWGTDAAAEAGVPLWAPSMAGDAEFTRWLGRYMRQSVSRNEIVPLLMTNFAYALPDVFPAVRVPALVLNRRDDPLAPVAYARRIASLIPDAHLVELDGADHLPFVGDAEAVAAEIEEFLVGSRAHTARQRRLLTLVFTDIAQSTTRVVERGDDVWRELLAAHDQDVRRHLARFGGQEVKHLGDGFLAAFDGPARAIRCALGISDAAERRGLVAPGRRAHRRVRAGRRRRPRHRRARRRPTRRPGRARRDPGVEHRARPRRRLGHPLRRGP